MKGSDDSSDLANEIKVKKANVESPVIDTLKGSLNGDWAKSLQFFIENPFQEDCLMWPIINVENTGFRKINQCSCCDDTFK